MSIKQWLCSHDWEWWVNFRKPLIPEQKKEKVKIRHDSSIWLCRKCRKEQTRSYAYYG